MKLLFTIALILIINNFLITSGSNLFFQGHLFVADYYSRKTAKKSSSGTATSFMRLNDSDKKAQCLKISTDVVRFSLVPKDSENIQPPDITDHLQSITEDILAYYDDPNTKPSSHEVLEVKLQGRRGSTFESIFGVPCVWRDNFVLLVTEGTDSNHFYVLGKNEQVPAPQFLGLVEEIATTIDQVTSRNEEALNQAFRLSQISLCKRTPELCNKTIHELDKFNQLRACSSAYMVWFGVHHVPVNRQHFVRDVGGLELKIEPQEFFNANVASRLDDPVKVIKCVIDTDIDHPQFYLAKDETNTGAGFILQQVDPQKYRVIMRLENVLGLETLNFD